MINIKLGVIPTRRDIFSKEEALKYKELILQKLATMNITFVDIEDANDEGLLFDDNDVDKVVDKMIKEKVDALFFPHCNFGTEYLVAQVAKKMNLPILIWGPRDESPLGDGSRLRDSQCGLFATGKVLRRFRCKFTYLPMCRLENQEFYEGIRRFLATVNIIKELKDLTILQIATRPSGFWTMMVNEGELLEKFNIKIHPVTLAEVKDEMDAVEQNKKDEVIQVIDYLKKETIIEISDEALVKVAALKVAIKSIAKRYNCKAAAVQCWNAMQGVLGIFPCAANALLTDEKFPVACETDIHGAITSIIAQAASIEDNVTFFADWTVPHPTNNNAELLQHCGPWPISLMEEKPRLGAPFAFNHSHPGSLHGKIKEGEMTILRFDGDNGEYSLLMGKAKTIPGPFNQGTYIWIEVDDLKKLEDKLVCGPYVHHCTGIYEDILPQVFEACKYIEGLTPDPYDCDNEVLKALVSGEK